ncbi:PKD domain-containing protein, partial [Pseudokineococcus lusitanus]|uniref:PKD domain-containing protein n=1 Tax=Pseudokineococcus lusitanus TaxID=763993 RepID=UPI000F462B22
ATASTATAQHTYAAAGSYEVTLVVTDTAGHTATAKRSVTVTAPVPVGPTVLGADAFGRTVAGGWGTADRGGAWTTSGTASSFSVQGGLGLVRSERVGVNRSVALPGLQSTATDLRLTTSLDTAPTGGGTYVSVIGRRVSATDDYRAKLRYQADGRVLVYLTRVVGGTETTLTSAVVSGAVAAADRPLEVRFQVTGTGPTALAVKVWPQGSPEPATWTSRTTDTTAVLQARGGIGALLYVSSTGAPVTARFDDVAATDVP